MKWIQPQKTRKTEAIGSDLFRVFCVFRGSLIFSQRWFAEFPSMYISSNVYWVVDGIDPTTEYTEKGTTNFKSFRVVRVFRGLFFC